MRPTTTRRPSPLRILRAHVQAKADAVVNFAVSWREAEAKTGPFAEADGEEIANEYRDMLCDAVVQYREARALLAQAEGQAEGPDHA